MNQDIIKGKWKEIQGIVKQQWGKLTDDDIATMEGSSQQLEGILQKKYGYAKDQAQQEIANFVKKHNLDKK